MTNDLTWIEISSKNIKHNVSALRNLIGGNCLLAPCIKGNAYGHGLEGVAKIVAESQVDWICIDSFTELQIIRDQGVNLPVLIIGTIQKELIAAAAALNASFLIFSLDDAKQISEQCALEHQTAKVHLKIDTGMSRRGVMPSKALETIRSINGLKNIEIEGIGTHFATSEYVGNTHFFKEQFNVLTDLLSTLKSQGICAKYIHSSNSGATIRYPGSHFNLVRPGLSIYGYFPNKEIKKWSNQKGIQLKPSLTLKTRVSGLKTIPESSCVGYGCTMKTRRDTDVAILPIGYYDGLDRGLSNYGYALISGRRAKIIGQISMNVTVVDITGIDDVSIGDESVLIGCQGEEEITAEEVAGQLGTINYEVLTRLREGIPRYYI